MNTVGTTPDTVIRGWRSLFYRGPAIAVLREEYAKRGRIDARTPIATTHEVRIGAPVATVWAVLSDARNWAAVDPDIHDVHIEEGVRPDAAFTWVNGKTRLRSRFAVVDPGREITWTGCAFGAKVVHRHLLVAIDDTTTRLTTEESMAGMLLVLLYSRAKLHAGLEKWLDAIKRAAEAR